MYCAYVCTYIIFSIYLSLVDKLMLCPQCYDQDIYMKIIDILILFAVQMDSIMKCLDSMADLFSTFCLFDQLVFEEPSYCFL